MLTAAAKHCLRRPSLWRRSSVVTRAFSRSTVQAITPFLSEYQAHVEERAAEANGMGVAPKPLSAEQVSSLLQELKDGVGDASDRQELLTLLSHRIPPGVDEAAYVKAGFLSALATEQETLAEISRQEAVKLLGTMQGGYNVATLVDLLKDYD